MFFRNQPIKNLLQKQTTYTAPGGEAPKIYGDILTSEPHILIAGATGSGKSVLVNSLLARLIMGKTPASAQLILIDPKRVELFPLRSLPHCIGYADTPQGAAFELSKAVNLMNARYTQMQAQGVKNYQGAAVYIIIDEYADLIVTAKKQVEPLITRLIQLGRAANIHLIIATQRPTREVISGAIRVNLDCKIALHCATAQDSRNILGQTGAETLPRFGYCYMLNSDGLNCWELPPIDDKLPALVRWWTSPECRRATA